MLELREHQDPGRRLEDFAALEREFGSRADPLDRWETHIAVRDYAGAVELLDTVDAANLPVAEWRALVVPNVDLARIITYGLQDAPDRLAPLLSEARARLDREPESRVGYWGANRHLALAFFSAAEGSAEEAQRLVRLWFREATGDLAELANLRHYACRALGMAGAASAAVECIRSGLAEPSFVMPFVEPFLPYYDAIREQPAFVDLLVEIQGQ
jgi:hypothetical protein